MEPRTRYTKSADGTNIAYAVIGEGEPVLAASMAWGDLHLYRSAFRNMHSMYESWASSGLRVALYDGRGFGSSDHDVKRQELAARLEDAQAVVDACGLDNFCLTAIAAGAPVAIAYAAANPARVRKLIIINGYARGEDFYRVVPAMRILRGLKDMAEEDWHTFLMTTTSAVTQFSDPESSASMAAAFRSSTSPREYLAWMNASAEIDVTALPPKVKAKTLVAAVNQMMPGSVSLSRELAAGIPDAELVELDTGPDFARILGAFLNGQVADVASIHAGTTFRTILFTDIVGHTEIMRRLGDEKGRAVLREHEAITREVLRQHGGAEVKTMGDGFLASFPSVTRAVECAVELQKAFAERNASSEEPLQLRVGLNAGEPVEDDGDLFGETVILASRIAAMAEGGEILASLAVRELCAGKGFLFADMGEHAMRGFEDPVRVFAVKPRD
jgi:class 3 adenylate cyclase